MDFAVDVSPAEWLYLVHHARLVVTDSFHGTVFSIIFNKEFYSITNIERGGSRFTSLLSQFDLISRLYTSINEISLVEDTIINWDTINSKRDELKEFSINFLISSLI
jgi:exopolysaccharide biosynthesis predicted pyruvyltransferase EpsI